MGHTEVIAKSDTGEVVSVKRESDRTLIYLNAHYCVIANPGEKVRVGDTVEFAPFGVNFGWFVRVK